MREKSRLLLSKISKFSQCKCSNKIRVKQIMKLTFDILFLTLTMCEKNNQKNQLTVSQ
jgi:hypothetical protein